MSLSIEILENIQRNNLLSYGVEPRFVEGRYRQLTKRIFNNSDLYIDFFSDTSVQPSLTYEMLRQLASKYLSEKISRYQNPHHYIILRQCEEDIRWAISALEYNIIDYPILGNIFSAEFNAEVWSHPLLKQKLIFFQDGILDFFDVLCRTVGAVCNCERMNDNSYLCQFEVNHARFILENNDRIIQFFGTALMGILTKDVETLAASSLVRPQPERHVFLLQSCLRASIWRFIVGHEYGHILNGDLNDEAKYNITVDGIDGIKKAKTEWREEFNADAKGFELMHHFMSEVHGSDLLRSLNALVIFYAGIDGVYKTIFETTGRFYPEEFPSHPPPIERWQYVTAAVNRAYEDKKHLQNCIDQCAKLGEVVDVIFDCCTKSIAQEFHKNHEVIRKSWFRE